MSNFLTRAASGIISQSDRIVLSGLTSFSSSTRDPLTGLASLLYGNISKGIKIGAERLRRRSDDYDRATPADDTSLPVFENSGLVVEKLTEISSKIDRLIELKLEEKQDLDEQNRKELELLKAKRQDELEALREKNKPVEPMRLPEKADDPKKGGILGKILNGLLGGALMGGGILKKVIGGFLGGSLIGAFAPKIVDFFKWILTSSVGLLFSSGKLIFNVIKTALSSIVTTSVGRLIGGIGALIYDGIAGYFKSEEWGVSKISGVIGGMLGGTFQNETLNIFVNMGKWALLGARAGTVFGPLGTAIGGAVGALLGGVLGYFGGEKIAKWLDEFGTWVSNLVDKAWEKLEDIAISIWNTILYPWEKAKELWPKIAKRLDQKWSELTDFRSFDQRVKDAKSAPMQYDDYIVGGVSKTRAEQLEKQRRENLGDKRQEIKIDSLTTNVDKMSYDISRFIGEISKAKESSQIAPTNEANLDQYLSLASLEEKAYLNVARKKAQKLQPGQIAEVHADEIRQEMAKLSGTDLNKDKTLTYADAITRASQIYGVPEFVIKKVMMRESSGDKNAVSKKGAMGLMQTLPRTFADMKKEDPHIITGDIKDPKSNIFAGARYLKQQKDRYGDWYTAFLAYHAGPGNVDKLLKTGINPAVGSESISYAEKLTKDLAINLKGTPEDLKTSFEGLQVEVDKATKVMEDYNKGYTSDFGGWAAESLEIIKSIKNGVLPVEAMKAMNQYVNFNQNIMGGQGEKQPHNFQPGSAPAAFDR